MAFTDINVWKQILQDYQDEIGYLSIHDKISKIIYTMDSCKPSVLKDEIENEWLNMLSFKDETSNVIFRIKNVNDVTYYNDTIFPRAYFREYFTTCFNYTSDFYFNVHLWFADLQPSMPRIQCQIVRIVNDVETIIQDDTYDMGGDGDLFSYTGGLDALMGHNVSVDSVTMTSIFPMYETTYTNYLDLNVDASTISYYWHSVTSTHNGRVSETCRNWPYQGSSIDIESILLEGGEEVDPSKYAHNTYYFFNKTYSNDNILIRSIKGEYKGTGRLCGYLNRKYPYNITLVNNGELLEKINDDTEWHTPTYPRLTSNDTLNNYYGLLDTNIPIFGSLTDAVDYLLTGDTDKALNQSDLDKSAKTGMDGTEARFERANTYDIRAVASRILDVSEVHSDIIRWMESLNDPSVSETIDMFWWTNNPIECLTSYYWSPLDMSEIGRTLPHSAHLVKFGGVVAKNVDTGDDISATPLNAQGAEILLGQYQFNRKYNDWRDYTLFNYKLYLPFYGLVDLEPYYITGKRLEVKYVYYPTNHTIRYMIFVKQNLYKAIDCSVGIDLPMTSSDAVGKAQKNFSDALSIPSDVKSITEGNVIGGITSIIGHGLEMSKKPSLLTWGSINPTTNIGDPLQAMLYIEEQQTIIPSKLYETYGHANYYIGSIGALSGYCEFSDVRLTGCDTLSDNEKEELKELLKKGVML